MYKSIFYDRKNNLIHVNDDDRGWVKFPYQKYAYRKSSSGKYKSIFGDKLEKITKVNPNEEGLFESDVPVETRILVDGYYESDDASKNHSIFYFDIETQIGNGMPDPIKAEQEITAISFYSTKLKQYYALIVGDSDILSNIEYPNVNVLRFDNEEGLLEKFLNLYEKCSPDILTGWNSDFFDVPYLYNRISLIFNENESSRLSPLGICYYNQFKKKMVIGGVSCIDYLVLYKKYSGKNLPNYRLDTVAKEVLNKGKISFDGNLNDLLKNDPKKFLEYNINDTQLIVEMDNKLNFIQLAIDICHTAHVQYEEYGTSSKVMEGAILTLLKNKNLIAPNKPTNGREEYNESLESDEEGFIGAYVKEPVPGLYEWVINADLNSLYPNTIRTLNISPETKVGKVLNWTDLHKDGNLSTLQEGNFQMESFDKSVCVLSKKEFLDLIERNKYNLSSNGVLYRSDKIGILKEIITRWYDLRKEYKKKMKVAIENGNKQEEEFWSRREQVQKILLNSLYGVLGLSVFRFSDVDNAQSVTLSGQDIIKYSEKYANNLCHQYCQFYKIDVDKNHDFVQYLDTDSIYISLLFATTYKKLNNAQCKKFSMEFCNTIADKINKTYKDFVLTAFNSNEHYLNIEADACAETAIWLKKKKYALYLFAELSKNKIYDKPKLKVLGLDIVRSSFPKLFQNFMDKFLHSILSRKNNDTVNLLIDECKKLSLDCELHIIAKNTSVKDIRKYEQKNRVPFSDFVSGSPAHVKAAISFNDFLRYKKLTDQHELIYNGEKIKWVYLKDNPYKIEGLAFKDDGKDAKELLDYINKYIDRKKCFDSELSEKIKSFYDALRWKFTTQTEKKLNSFFE